MPDTAAAAPRKPRRILLIASLCLNLILVPVVVGGIFVGWQRAALGGAGLNMPFHPRNLAAMLPPEGKAKIEDALAGRRLEMALLARKSRLARLAAYRAFKAEPFDQQAFERALDDIIAADAAVVTASKPIILDIVRSLTPEERAIIAGKIAQRRKMRLEEGRGGPGRATDLPLSP